MSVEDLVVENAGWIRLRARKYYKNTDDADDLASETIFKCLSQASTFDKTKSFRPWALAIMANTYITQYNRRKCVLLTGIDGHEAPYYNDTPDQLAAVNRIYSIIRECGRKSCCIECVMLYAEGYAYDEISEMLHIPIGTVKSRISSGRKMLRDNLV